MKNIFLLICCIAVTGLGYANKVAYQLDVNPNNPNELIVNAVPNFDSSETAFAGGNVVVFAKTELKSIISTTANWETALNGVNFMGQKVYQFHTSELTEKVIDGTTELFRLTFSSAKAANSVRLLNQKNAVDIDASTSSVDFKVMAAGIHHTAALKTGNMIDGTAFNGILGGNKYTSAATIAVNKADISPNPSNGELVNVNIDATATENVLLQVQSLNGQVLHTLNTDLVEGKNNFELNLNNLVAGMYVITITGERTNHISQLSIVK